MHDNPRRGIVLIVATTIIFAIQDGISFYRCRFSAKSLAGGGVRLLAPGICRCLGDPAARLISLC